ncbi:MAG: hypothetical protein ABR576_04855 [Thermoanaerobaculia bacterium]
MSNRIGWRRGVPGLGQLARGVEGLSGGAGSRSGAGAGWVEEVMAVSFAKSLGRAEQNESVFQIGSQIWPEGSRNLAEAKQIAKSLRRNALPRLSSPLVAPGQGNLGRAAPVETWLGEEAAEN